MFFSCIFVLQHSRVCRHGVCEDGRMIFFSSTLTILFFFCFGNLHPPTPPPTPTHLFVCLFSQTWKRYHTQDSSWRKHTRHHVFASPPTQRVSVSWTDQGSQFGAKCGRAVGAGCTSLTQLYRCVSFVARRKVHATVRSRNSGTVSRSLVWDVDSQTLYMYVFCIFRPHTLLHSFTRGNPIFDPVAPLFVFSFHHRRRISSNSASHSSTCVSVSMTLRRNLPKRLL